MIPRPHVPIALILSVSLIMPFAVRAEDVLPCSVAGQFYPASKEELEKTVDSFLNTPELSTATIVEGKRIFALISPHAGYPYSGKAAGQGYKLIQGKKYSTVVVIGTGHRFPFHGVAVYPSGSVRTPLGDIPVDAEFASALTNGKNIRVEPRAFEGEHSVEVQLPFLQRALSGFKVVPVVTGTCSFQDCRDLADRLKAAAGKREDILVVASSDMYHGYDYDQAEAVDSATLEKIKAMDAAGLYAGLEDNSLQLCGGYGTVAVLLAAKELGYTSAVPLLHTTSAKETGKMLKGVWTVGYSSVVIGAAGKGGMMLTDAQKKKLLAIARQTIGTYLKTHKKPQLTETDPLLTAKMGAFVTLHEHGQLRGCIGSMVGTQPLYLTIRDMAVEAATGDPRFSPVTSTELDDIEIEISVLSPMEKVDGPEKIEMGTHGVMVRKGYNCGVFLPQVATETGWNREQFLSCLCAEKAGLHPEAWKDKATDLYTFTATVFSEKELGR